MSYLERNLLKNIEKWMDRREILAIKGPRQAGKTTLLEMIKEWLIKSKKVNEDNIIYLTLEDRDILEKLIVNEKEFIQSFIKDKSKRHYFLLDEFHYLKDGGRKLKFLYDTIENVKFIITGSSSLEITALSKYLVGRVFSFYLMPFSFYEFLKAKDERIAGIHKERSTKIYNYLTKNIKFKINNDIFIKDLEKYLEDFMIFGGYPEVIKTDDIEAKKIILKNIYETYTSKDIIEILQIKDIFKFRTLVKALAAQIGSIINYNELTVVSSSYYKEVLQSINALQETYIAIMVPPYHKNLKTELKKNPKAYFIDLGLRNFIVNNYNPVSLREDAGEMAENYAFSALANMLEGFGKIKYWRTIGKAEVDFIIDLNSEIVPIEIKFSNISEPKVTRSMRSFISAYSPSRAIVFTKNLCAERGVDNTAVKFVPLCYL